MKKFLIVLILPLILMTACTNTIGQIKDGYTDLGNLKIPQFEKPKIGEEIAVVTTNMGVIKIKLLDEAAPIGVKQFKEWVKEDKYSKSVFGRINNNRNIQVFKEEYRANMKDNEIDKYYEGILDEMSFEPDYTVETNPNYHNFSGAVGFMVYNSRDMENRQIGCFYIVANEGVDEAILDIMENMPSNYGFTKDILTAYRKIGGVLEYNGNLTIFGQVFYGMDIVYKINHMLVDENSFPLEGPVIIEKIEILEYEGK